MSSTGGNNTTKNCGGSNESDSISNNNGNNEKDEERSKRWGGTRVGRNILEVIGNTPAVILEGFCSKLGLEAKILMKLEFLNPGFSVKARPAVCMLENAQENLEGKLIVESSSGNTAVALAMACAVKKLRFRAVVDSLISQTKLKTLEALGAEIEKVEAVSSTNMQTLGDDDLSNLLKKNRRKRVEQLQKETPGGIFVPNQYKNPHNPLAHLTTTGPELFDQCEGKLDYLVLSASTGGQLLGLSRYMLKKIPTLKVVGVEPLGSRIFEEEEEEGRDENSAPEVKKSYYAGGSGLDYTPEFVSTLKREGGIHFEIKVSDLEALTAVNLLARSEGFLAGISTGQSLFAACCIAHFHALQGGDRKKVSVACIASDSGTNYLEIFDGKFLEKNGAADVSEGGMMKLVRERESSKFFKDLAKQSKDLL